MDGLVSIPAIKILTNGVPSVDARATPPWFAVLSFETSFPSASVLKPRIISGSATFNSWTLRNAVVPPSVIFPVTFKLRVTCKSLVTVASWGMTKFVGRLNVGVEPSPEVALTLIWFEVPVIDWT